MSLNIKVYGEQDGREKGINALLIGILILWEIVCIVVFVAGARTLAVGLFLASFVLFFVFVEYINRLRSIRVVSFEIKNPKLVVTSQESTREFELKSCKLQYHEDKDTWISLDCDGQSLSWTLVKPVSKEVLGFINKVIVLGAR